MKKSSLAAKILCVVLALTMVIIAAGCGKKNDDVTIGESENTTVQKTYTDTANTIKKSETVYVNLDNAGNVTNVNVTDWLHTDKAEVQVADVSDLTSIYNVKTNSNPTIDGQNLTWNMDTTDLYYTGKSDKALPISISVKYFLDDNEVTPEEIAGKSGKIRIDVDVKNTDAHTVTIGGKETTVYNPIIVVGGMILKQENFQNVTVKNGTSIGDGSKQIALLVGAPGVNESLALDTIKIEGLEGFDFSTSYSITADATNFELSNMMFAAIPVTSLDSFGVGELPDSITEAKDKLKDLQTLEESIKSLGVDELVNSFFSDSSNMQSINTLINNATTLYNNNKALIDIAPKYLTEENITNLNKLVNDLNNVDINKLTATLSDPTVQALIKKLPSLASAMKELPALTADIEALTPLFESLNKDMSNPEVAKAIDNLPETLKALSQMQDVLGKNKDLINALNKLVSNEGEDAIKNLSKALSNISNGDINVSSITNNADELVSRMDAWLQVGKDYKIFTTAPENMETNVMFVFQMPEISYTQVKEEQQAQEDDSNALVKWFKKTFSKSDDE